MKEHDCLRRFLFEDLHVRGEWVRLQDSWQAAKQYQVLNTEVESLLGQALAAVTLLSATIKFQGSMILQAQGNGALRTLVVQATHERKIRGLVRYNSEVSGKTLSEMMGQGRVVLTIESENAAPYQGVVALEGETFADVLHTYFLQSEQLQTRLWLFADATQVVGLFLQELPSENRDKADWQRIEILANTVKAGELFTLDCEEVLYRLFNEEKVRVFPAESVQFSCSCSAEKISTTLKNLGQTELEGILAERGVIEVDCEFCGKKYQFNEQEIHAFF